MKIANKLKFLLSLSFLIIFALSSCKMKAEQNSLTNHFEIIDSLISENLFKDAVDELKKTEKQCYDSWSYLGVYKRYQQISETELAGKTIANAINKNPKNQELLAVYADYLIQQQDYDKAEDISKNLQGTKYGSFYSEAVLRNLEKKLNDNSFIEKNKRKKQKKSDKKEIAELSISDYYKNPDYYSIYYDAYTSSLNPIWIRNCAIFQLEQGLFDNASILFPNKFANTEDAYFWALVMYDSGKYYEAIEALKAAESYLSDYSILSNDRKLNITPIKITALQSDAYLAASNLENAELFRKKIVAEKDKLGDFASEDEELLSSIFLNSSIYSINNDDFDTASDLLLFTVNRWPNYTPALILYSDFAYNSNVQRVEDEEQLALRRAGIVSLEMEKYDKRIKIPLSDALYRLDIALAENNDPRLYIKKLDLKYKQEKNYSVKEKTADLWNVLEEAYNKDNKYESLLVQYVLSYLLQTKQYDDAFELFNKYILSSYEFNKKEDFWMQFENTLPFMDERIAEYGAWFATYYKLIDEAIRLYEYCVYESSGILGEGIVSTKSSVESCMNLADIYFSIGKSDRALDLYGRIVGRESNKYIRSEIFYRIACIYVSKNDLKNALRSIEYAVSLYPDNSRAALLKSKLQNKDSW